MTSQNVLVETAPSIEPAIAANPDVVTIETRFGDMDFQLKNSIYMPRGMLGYAEHHVFGIANMPDPKLEQFKLFQSLEEAALSFIVAPMTAGNDTIEAGDMEAACESLTIEPANAVLLLVVSTRRIGASTQVTVNLRAPIILDGENQHAFQHVLMNNKYPVRQIIGAAAKSAD